MAISTIPLYKYGKLNHVSFNVSNYDNGNLCVDLLMHNEPDAVHMENLTIDAGMPCDANCAFIDIDSHGNEIVEWLLAYRIGRLTGRVEADCPEMMFNMDSLSRYDGTEIIGYDGDYKPYSANTQH